MKPIKICITGGHATPALAVIEVMKKKHPEWELLWVGRAVALEGSNVRSEESRLVSDAGIPFYSIDAGRLSRVFSFASIVSFLKIPIGYIQSFFFLLRHRPTMILSFGGYVAVPIAVHAWVLSIPVVTHEQSHTPGIANRIISMFAKKIFVSHKDSLSLFPAKKTVYTGLPIRSGIFTAPKEPSFLYSRESLPMLYIMGGSTGAKSINTVVYEILPRLLSTYRIIHQVGALSFDEAKKIKAALSAHGDRYTVLPYIDISDLAWVYKHASLVIGRSGANTVGEIRALGLRAICIPLSWGGSHEQRLNAEALVKHNQALIVEQSQLSPDTLEKAIAVMEKQKNISYHPESSFRASAMIVEELETLL